MSARKAKAKDLAGTVYAKPRSDVYTVMLGLSLVAVLLAILCLYFEMQTYNFDITAEEAKRAATAVPAPVAPANPVPAAPAPAAPANPT